MNKSPEIERCFRLYRIENKPGREVAEILGTNIQNVTRWSQRFEQRFPERAHAMIAEARQAATTTTPARSAFLDRVRDEVERMQDEDTIPGFEANDRDDGMHADELPLEGADGEPLDALEYTRRLLVNTQRRGVRAQHAGDHITAQRCGRDAAQLVTVLARIERVAQDGADVLHISRAEIEKTWKEIMGKVRVIGSRPLVCEHCGKQMMVAFASDPGTSEEPK